MNTKLYKIVVFLLAVIVGWVVMNALISCSSLTGPEDLSYTMIKYRDFEIVDGLAVHYTGYSARGYEWSNYQSIATVDSKEYSATHPTGEYITYGKELKWRGKKWRCKTIKSSYIEIAAY